MRTILTAVLLVGFVFAGCKSGTQPTSRNVGETVDPNTPRLNSPLPDRAYKADITLAAPLTALKAGQKQIINVRIKNASDVLWLVYGTGESNKYRVAVGDTWLDSNGKVITNMDGRYGLPADLRPGREVEVPLTITVPANPGKYILQLDLVQEGVTWFQDKGSPVLKVNVDVQ